MDTGYYKFYVSRKNIIILFISFAIFFYWLYQQNLMSCNLIMIFLAILAVIFLKLIKTPFVEITPSYIKIRNFEKLYWTEIDRIEYVRKNINGREFIVCNLWPRNIEKYHFNSIQKLNIKTNYSPFCIIKVWTLSSENWNRLMTILKERVPNNNIEF